MTGDRRARLFLVDYAHPTLGRRTLRIRATSSAAAVRTARRAIARVGGRYRGIRDKRVGGHYLGIREP